MAPDHDAALSAVEFEQGDLRVELPPLRAWLVRVLESEMQKHRVGKIIFELGQFVQIGRESHAGNHSRASGRPALQVLPYQGNARPRDESHRRIQPPRIQQDALEIRLQSAAGARVEEPWVQVSPTADARRFAGLVSRGRR